MMLKNKTEFKISKQAKNFKCLSIVIWVNINLFSTNSIIGQGGEIHKQRNIDIHGKRRRSYYKLEVGIY